MRRARPNHDADSGRRQSRRDGDRRETGGAGATTHEAPLASLHRAGGNQAVQSAVDDERISRSPADSHSPGDGRGTGRGTQETTAQRADAGANARRTGESEFSERESESSDRESAIERAIQPKLTVSSPGDRYEREADRVAAAVMRSEDEAVDQSQSADGLPALQRMCSRCRQRFQQGKSLDCEECEAELQRAVDSGDERTIDDDSEVTRQINRARSGGRRLPEETRSYFESRMGQDFGDVRVHTGSQADRAARSVNARAFTLGSDVVFRSGEYSPNTRSGKRLLAHELTHVVQQGGGRDVPSQESPVTAETERGVQRIGGERLQRWKFGDPWKLNPVPDNDWKEVPQDERDRVREAMGLIEPVATNPDRHPGCHGAFSDHCTASGVNSLETIFQNAILWKTENDALGEMIEGEYNVAYGDESYRWGDWTLAATFIHEFAHACGIEHANDFDNEDAVAACGFPTTDELSSDEVEVEEDGQTKTYYFEGKPEQPESEPFGAGKMYHLD